MDREEFQLVCGAARDLPSLAARRPPPRPAHAVDVAADVLLLNAARSVVPDQGHRGASAGASRIHVELSQLALPRYWPFG